MTPEVVMYVALHVYSVSIVFTVRVTRVLELLSARVSVVMATTSDPLILSKVTLTLTSVVTAVSTVTEQVMSWGVPAVKGDVGVVRITVGEGTV